MFNFSNVKKLFSYNWKIMIKSLIPTGEKNELKENEYKNILNGAILHIIAAAFLEIAAILIAIFTFMGVYKTIYGSKIASYVINLVVKEQMLTWLLDIFKRSIIPILIIVYINIMKKKKQSTIPYFIMLIIMLLDVLGYGYGLIGWIPSLFTSPIYAIVGLAGTFLMLLGCVHISIGCIDFLSETNINNTKLNQASTNTQQFVQTAVEPNYTQQQMPSNQNVQTFVQPNTDLTQAAPQSNYAQQTHTNTQQFAQIAIEPNYTQQQMPSNQNVQTFVQPNTDLTQAAPQSNYAQQTHTNTQQFAQIAVEPNYTQQQMPSNQNVQTFVQPNTDLTQATLQSNYAQQTHTNTQQYKTCPNCHYAVSNDKNFCPNCGTKI